MAKITLSDGKVINFQPNEIELINDGSNNIKLKDGTIIKLNKENFNKLNTYKVSKNNENKVNNKELNTNKEKDNDAIEEDINNISLDKIDNLIKKKKDILNLSNIGGASGGLLASDLTRVKGTIDSLEKWRSKYDKASLDDKVFILKNMKGNYSNINNIINKVHEDKMNQLKQLEGSIDNSLKKDFDKFNSDITSLKESLNSSSNKKEDNKKELEEGMYGIIPEPEINKEQVKEKVETNPKGVEINYINRDINKNADGTYSYISKLDGKEKKFNSLDEAKKDINTGVTGFRNYKDALATDINTSIQSAIKESGITDTKKIADFKKQQIDKLKGNTELKSKGFKDIDFDNIIG